MSNEKKQDVFETIADKYAGYDDELYERYLKQYDDALPDNIPVIPKEVAYVIEEGNDDGDYKLGVAFYAAYEGILQPSAANWILMHAELFARAWLDGYQMEE